MAKRLALLIGADTFTDHRYQTLRTPVQDVETLARVLTEHGDFEVSKLTNEPSQVVREAIESLFAKTKRNDLVLIYFSGHGDKTRDGSLYLVTPNTLFKQLRSTGIGDRFIHKVVEDSRSKCHIIVLDCCFSGAFAKGPAADKQLDLKRLAGEGTIVLASSDAAHPSFEEVEECSLFTNCLIKGIVTGEADRNRDGHITVTELFRYIEESVQSERPDQRPVMKNSAKRGKIVLARNPRMSEVPPEPTKERSSVLHLWRDVIWALTANKKPGAWTLLTFTLIALVLSLIIGLVKPDPERLLAEGIAPTRTPTAGMVTMSTAHDMESLTPSAIFSPSPTILPRPTGPPIIRIEPSMPQQQAKCGTAETYRLSLGIYNDSDFSTGKLLLGVRLGGDVERVKEATYTVFQESTRGPEEALAPNEEVEWFPVGDIPAQDNLYIEFEISISGNEKAFVVLVAGVALEEYESRPIRGQASYYISHCSAVTPSPILSITPEPLPTPTPTPVLGQSSTPTTQSPSPTTPSPTIPSLTPSPTTPSPTTPSPTTPSPTTPPRIRTTHSPSPTPTPTLPRRTQTP